MRGPGGRTILWSGALLLGLVGWVRWNRALPGIEVSTDTMGDRVLKDAWDLPIDSAAELTRAIVASNPFRLGRRPTTVPFRPDGVYQPTVETTERPEPAPILLTGILGGPPWRALVRVTGSTSRDQIVVPGDTVAGFRVLVVQRDSLVLEGTDTTLTMLLNQR